MWGKLIQSLIGVFLLWFYYNFDSCININLIPHTSLPHDDVTEGVGYSVAIMVE